MKRAAVALLITMAVLISGCATVVKGGSQPITVKTDPPGAACELNRKGITVGVVSPTPGTTQVSKSATDLEVSCKKTGYLDANAKLPASFQGWTLGNILIGGVVGIVVDAASGAIAEYGPEILVKLLPASFRSVEERDVLYDGWRDEVSNESAKQKSAIESKCAKSECDGLLRKAAQETQVALAEVEAARMRAKITDTGLQSAAEASPVPVVAPATAPVVAGAIPGPVPDANYPSIGDRWTYTLRDRGRTVSMVTVEVIGSRAGKARERITREGYPGFTAEREVDVDFNPTRFQPPVALPGGYQLWEIAPYFPSGTQLKVGNRWGPISGEFYLPKFGKKTLLTRVSVAGEETVHVPGGDFHTWKIETEPVNAGTGGDNAVLTCAYWYSPESRRVVKIRFETIHSVQVASTSESYELVRFDPAK